jgi:hypothetical protein
MIILPYDGFEEYMRLEFANRHPGCGGTFSVANDDTVGFTVNVGGPT